MSSRMNRLGKSEVYFNRVVPLDEVISKIDAVTDADIRRVAEVVFPADAALLTVAAVGPFDENHKNLQAGEDAEGIVETDGE